MTTLLIDGDIFAYRSSVAVEREIDWGDGLWTLHAYEHEAINSFEGLLRAVREQLGVTKSTRIIFALTDSESNWRKEIMPDYKAHRKSQRKPILLNFMQDYVRENYETYERPTLEADDVLGILGTSMSIIRGPRTLVSVDKDFYGVPCNYYRFSQGDGHVESITETQADRFHLIQTLSGDTADGYSGCPGVGPKTAEKLLDAVEPSEWWRVVVEQFEKKGLSEEAALLNARVARICRNTDYDFRRKKVKLWSPYTHS